MAYAGLSYVINATIASEGAKQKAPLGEGAQVDLTRRIRGRRRRYLTADWPRTSGLPALTGLCHRVTIEERKRIREPWLRRVAVRRSASAPD